MVIKHKFFSQIILTIFFSNYIKTSREASKKSLVKHIKILLKKKKIKNENMVVKDIRISQKPLTKVKGV